MPTVIRDQSRRTNIAKFTVQTRQVRPSGRRKQIQAELVIGPLNLARPEATPHQHWPEIVFVVIHLMIVDFDFPTEANPKCG